MDIDTWFWLAVAFWLGTCAGFAVFALVHLDGAPTPGGAPSSVPCAPTCCRRTSPASDLFAWGRYGVIPPPCELGSLAAATSMRLRRSDFRRYSEPDAAVPSRAPLLIFRSSLNGV
jgi:hypothetical protein